MEYLRNAWYVAATSSEVEQGALFHRKILGEEILIYRTQDGRSVAIRNRCPHRFAPLHLGKLKGDVVECGYHGVQFDCSGQCVKNPHGDGAIPKAAVIKAYPLAERYGFIWIWMGDANHPKKANEQMLPFIKKAVPNCFHGGTHVSVNYELLMDNLMDISHIDFLHTFLSTGGELSQTKPSIEDTPNGVEIKWHYHAPEPMPFLAPFMPNPNTPVDAWMEITWTVPSFIMLRLGCTPKGRSRDEGVETFAMHFLTPESERSAHYFYAMERTFNVEDEALGPMFKEALLAVFNTEDRPMVEAVQEEMGTSDLWSLKPVLLANDLGQVRARRVLQKLISEEVTEQNRLLQDRPSVSS